MISNYISSCIKERDSIQSSIQEIELDLRNLIKQKGVEQNTFSSTQKQLSHIVNVKQEQLKETLKQLKLECEENCRDLDRTHEKKYRVNFISNKWKAIKSQLYLSHPESENLMRVDSQSEGFALRLRRNLHLQEKSVEQVVAP